MNIFWIVTDSICNYERSDLHGLLPIYKKLKLNNEGLYFEDCISQFPSTNLSLFSFLTGRFPYYVFPDYYRSIDNLPNLKYKNLVNPLKRENYKIQSIIFGREQALIFKEILNPYYENGMYKGDHWLDAKEVYEFFLQKVESFSLDERNFLFTFFRPSGPQTDLYLGKIIEYLKEQEYWENSIIVINSDHGFYDKNLYKKTKLLHFDDIHQSSMQPILFMKLPQNLTKSPSKSIEKRVYLIDIMETILDYLNINATHERESLSFKGLIEKNIDVNKNRKIRGDCYLMFQAVKRTMIIKSNWKLVNNNGIFSLYNLSEDHLERKDAKNEHHEIYDELYQFYLMTELRAYKTFESLLYSLYEQSILPKLKSSKIFIPRQFPPQLVRFLKENLAKNNTIINTQDLNDLQLNDDQKLTTILFYNRLTGIRLKKLIRKYKEQTKRFIILDTELNEVSSQLNQTGYLKFILRSIWARRKLLFQRWKEIIVWILYFPLYFNKHARCYYK
ncbi:MAG: sulfatase-like hydrolase/transferase [Candidatus Lokiarchaeia archaeon]